MKKYSGHKLYKFPTGHTLRSECEYPYKLTMKGGHTHNHIRNTQANADVPRLGEPIVRFKGTDQEKG